MRTPPPKARPPANLPLDMDQLKDMIRLTVSDVLAELRAVQGEPLTEARVIELLREYVSGRRPRATPNAQCPDALLTQLEAKIK